MDMDEILAVEELSKEFPNPLFSRRKEKLCAVDGVSFTMQRGEILGVVGESGSGKSTLAQLLLHLIPRSSGRIRFFGEELNTMKGKRLMRFRKQAQIIFQDPFSSLNPKRRIFDTLYDVLKHHCLVKNKNEAQGLITTLLAEVGLPADASLRYPHAFSGGQRQRIAIARALAVAPEFLICDEILSALDLSIQAVMLSLLYELKVRRNLTLLFISHDLSTVKRFCDRILVFYRGKIVESGPVAELFAHPQHPYTKHLLASIPRSHPR